MMESGRVRNVLSPPQEAADFLRCSPITIKRLARDGKIPAHAVTNGVRKRWRFLISELAVNMGKVGIFS